MPRSDNSYVYINFSNSLWSSEFTKSIHHLLAVGADVSREEHWQECWLDLLVDLTSLEPGHLLKAFFFFSAENSPGRRVPFPHVQYLIWRHGGFGKNLGGSISLCSAASAVFDLAAGAKRWVAEEPGCFEDQMPVSAVRAGNVQTTARCWHLFRRTSRSKERK